MTDHEGREALLDRIGKLEAVLRDMVADTRETMNRKHIPGTLRAYAKKRVDDETAYIRRAATNTLTALDLLGED